MKNKKLRGKFYLNELEKTFFDYFERCLNANISSEQIVQQSPYLEKYYKQIVLNKLTRNEKYIFQPSFEKMISEWNFKNNLNENKNINT